MMADRRLNLCGPYSNEYKYYINIILTRSQVREKKGKEEKLQLIPLRSNCITLCTDTNAWPLYHQIPIYILRVIKQKWSKQDRKSEPETYKYNMKGKVHNM